MKRRYLMAVTLLIVALPADAQNKARSRDVLAPLDGYVTQVMKEWKVPGVAIAIVRNDSLILAKGYGVRTLGQSAPVDANSVFAIGSSSKAFTAALVGMAVDAGKMSWDDPVAKHLPGFQLNDTYASRDLTLRDALSHRSGLSRGDLTWYSGKYTRDEVMRRVRYLEPSWGFRSAFGYQNVMFLAAGEAVGKALQSDWDSLIRDRILVPLGMTRSNTSVRTLSGMDNVSSPHSEIRDTVRVIPWKNIDNIAPAGSINSSVTDMAQWVRLQLAQGKVNGKQLITSPTVEEMWTPNTHIRLQGPTASYLAPGANLSSYGLGWFVQDFKGHLAVHHGGNIDGFSAVVAMLPKQNMGVVVLTNMNGSPAPNTIFPYVFELLLGQTPQDWNATYSKMIGGVRAAGKAAEEAADKARVVGTKSTLGLDAYVGTWTDSLYGDIEIVQQGNALRFEYGALVGPIEHWHYDTFRATLDNGMGNAPLVFALNGEGKVTDLKSPLFPDHSFTKRPKPADPRAVVTLTPEQLGRFAGKYEPEGLPVQFDVALVGGLLKFSVPGQPAYTLVPVNETRFRLTLPAATLPEGFFMEFTVTADEVVGGTLEQPAPQPTLKLRKTKN